MSDVQETFNKKNAQIAAQKISQKYKKIKNKIPIPFNLAELADADNIVYDTDTNLGDVSSNKGAQIVAKRIPQKYRNIRLKTQPLPFNLLDIAEADTVDYNEHTNIQGVNVNKNAILTAKKISDKYRNTQRKRKRAASPEPIVVEIKNPKTASS